MINPPQFDYKLFEKLYREFLDLKSNLESSPQNHEGHDWIDMDDIEWIDDKNQILEKK